MHSSRRKGNMRRKECTIKQKSHEESVKALSKEIMNTNLKSKKKVQTQIRLNNKESEYSLN